MANRLIKIFLLAVSCFLIHSAQSLRAQGIEFMHNLDSALDKAKQENKMVFIDFYTSWCAPCKVMSDKVFPLEEAGTYYNSNFINCKIQCDDKGIGEQLGKKYQINAYPTLMFVDKSGTTVHSVAGGLDVKGLINLAKTAADPQKNQFAMIKEWESGNRSHTFAVRYFRNLIQSYRNEKATKDFNDYFATMTDEQKTSKNTYDLMQLVKIAPFSAPFDYLETNHKAYAKTVGAKQLDSVIANTYLWYLRGVQSGCQSSDKNMAPFYAALAKFKAKKYSYYDEYAMFYNVFESKDSNGKDDINIYMQRGTDFLKKYGKKNDSYTVSLTSMLGNWTGGKDKGHAGITWMDELLKRNRDPRYLNTYIYILWRNYHWDEAIAACYELKESLVKTGRSTKDIDNQIEQIKGYKLKYSK